MRQRIEQRPHGQRHLGAPISQQPVAVNRTQRNGGPASHGAGADQRHTSGHRGSLGKPDIVHSGHRETVTINHGPFRDQHLHDRIEKGHLDSLLHSKIGHKVDLHRQYSHHATGDVARRLGLHNQVSHHSQYRSYGHHGRICQEYLGHSFGHYYCGPSWYPSRVWWPRWNDWVSWCWWDYCTPVYDPRPIYCRPVVYPSCSRVVVYDYPVWQPLTTVTAGTWVDVPEVTVVAKQYDVQLLAVRFVDSGHPEKKEGPRFRVWIRNNSPDDVATPFNVMVIAADGDQLTKDLPQAGVRVDAIAAGETQAIDIRLPWDAYELSRDEAGRAVPFSDLHVVVDSNREITETSEDNNGIAIARGEILPVDPAAFSTDVDTVIPGEMVSIAGEGLGPEPGRVLLNVNGLELEPEIQGWYDLGVRIKVPSLPLTGITEAELVIVRSDSAATTPLKLKIAPVGTELLPAP